MTLDRLRTGERFGASWGTDVDAVLGDPAIDAVVVASPTPTHVDLLRISPTTRINLLIDVAYTLLDPRIRY